MGRQAHFTGGLLGRLDLILTWGFPEDAEFTGEAANVKNRIHKTYYRNSENQKGVQRIVVFWEEIGDSKSNELARAGLRSIALGNSDLLLSLYLSLSLSLPRSRSALFQAVSVMIYEISRNQMRVNFFP